MPLKVGVLGPVRVGGSNGEIDITRPAQRRLLSILAFADGSRISTDGLIERFWGDSPPETARAAIQTHVSGLRRLLGGGVVVTEGYGYRLNLDDNTLDTVMFTDLARSVSAHTTGRDWESALAATDEALGLWKGPPFVELTDDEFARPEISRLNELHLELLETKAEALIALDRPDQALPDLEKLVLEHPYRERMWEHLMTARYRLGRHTEALRAFQQVTDHLAEVGVEPGVPLRRLEERILLHDQTLTQTTHNLPTELDSFIGRETEIKDITRLLADNRLVTLTGPGGSGKTRLATHTAHQHLDAYPDGIHFVELADIDDSEYTSTEIANAIGIKPKTEDVLGTLAQALQDQTTLIILDNCEHLVEAVARDAHGLLSACPRLTVLTTSRSLLRVPGEVSYDVPGLAIPEVETPRTQVLDHDAVRLFNERSGSKGGTHLGDGDLEAVVQICRRLDGMPLAIELASARAQSLSVNEIASRLDQQFGLLSQGWSTAPSKHQTLEAAIDWSYQLLTPKQQMVFNRLSVFKGGFDLAMAEQVIADDLVERSEIAAVVSALVEQSMVIMQESETELPYRLLETIRQFGLSRLEASEDYEQIRDRHLEWGLHFSLNAWGSIYRPRQHETMRKIGVVLDNLMSAATWAGERDLDVAPLLGVAALYWETLGYLALTEDLLSRAIESNANPTYEAELRALRWRNHLSAGRTSEAMVEAEKAYQMVKDTPASDAKATVIWIYARGIVLDLDADPAEAKPLADEGVTVALALNNRIEEVRARRNRAEILVRCGEESEALAESKRAIQAAVELGDSRTTILACFDAITTAMYSRTARRSEPRRLVELIIEHADSEEQVIYLAADWLAQVYLQTGEWDEAEDVLTKDSQWSHLEGMNRESLLLPRAGLHWMQGDLVRAADDIRLHEEVGVNPRWYQDSFAVKAEVAADQGQIEEARLAADRYLEIPMHSSEEPNKLGTLGPLVRAEVNSALKALDNPLDEHSHHARETVSLMEEILRNNLPAHSGAPTWETHHTHLTFARAELSRLSASDPVLWQQAFEDADFIYYRLYAQVRLGESLLATGHPEEGQRQLSQGVEEARRIGASGLVYLGEDLLSG